MGFYGNIPSLTISGPTLPNAKLINGFVGGAGTGDIDLYTVPAGRRCYVLNQAVMNDTGGPVNYFGEVKISGTYYRLSATQNPASNTIVQVNTSGYLGYIAEAGETLAINIGTSGLNVWLRGIEFDNTSGLRSIKKFGSWSVGNNTLYTVTTNKTALLFGSSPSPTSAAQVVICNSSGNTRTYSIYAVPSGGSTASTNRVVNANTVSNNAHGTFSTVPCLNSGDFIVINTDATTDTQFAFVTTYEVP